MHLSSIFTVSYAISKALNRLFIAIDRVLEKVIHLDPYCIDQ